MNLQTYEHGEQTLVEWPTKAGTCFEKEVRCALFQSGCRKPAFAPPCNDKIFITPAQAVQLRLTS